MHYPQSTQYTAAGERQEIDRLGYYSWCHCDCAHQLSSVCTAYVVREPYKCTCHPHLSLHLPVSLSRCQQVGKPFLVSEKLDAHEEILHFWTSRAGMTTVNIKQIQILLVLSLLS